MIEDYSIICGCRYPKQIENKVGNIIYASCGHCPECVARKANKYQDQCIREASQSRFVVFFTLTYDELNVPVATYFIDKRSDGTNKVTFRDVTRRYVYKDKTKYKHLPEYNKVINEIYNVDENNFREFIKKASVKSKLYERENIEVHHSNMAVLRYNRHKDLQDFIKRLRFKVSEFTDEKLRFFGVSEYGPQTFRPHFHGTLFFDDEIIGARIIEFIGKCWKYGKVDCEFVRNANGCAKYVAGYLNSFSMLPDYLACESFRPRITHSLYLGSKTIAEVRDVIYKDIRKAFDAFDVVCSSGAFPYRPQKSHIGRLFPRIYGFSRQTTQNLLYLYESFYRFARNTDCICSEIAKYILTHQYDAECNHFLSLIDLQPITLNSPSCDADILLPEAVFDAYFNPFTEDDITDNDEAFKQYNRVYNVLLTSRNFIFFCCDNNIDMSLTRLKQIQEYYYLSAQLQLKKQYEFEDKHRSSLGYFPDDLFYTNSDTHFSSFGSNIMVKSYQSIKDEQYQKRVKHSELNDANKIFVDVLPTNY